MEETYTIEEVVEIIDSDGLGHAVQHFIDADQIEDERLKILWQDARFSLDALDSFLDIH